ncbi:hypothetical protein [Chryseobacterium sp. EO14]|uniref:hypothetical protein n=1 Tax=Chryseobacterium sp. EO14 TaxID=2950551 RepID=UPI00210929B8|nr:hypothetical protein [Chryseobacterium sp. EO14]MCQ4142677.1 hypothetical protein [Chryseobacterium sp. EO14]
MIREIYIINKKTVDDFENEIGFEIESDYVIVLYDKTDGSVIGEIYNKFDGWLEADINPEYEIQSLQIEIFLQKFLNNENDPIWNRCKKDLSDIHIVDKDLSKWKDRIGYIYLN